MLTGVVGYKSHWHYLVSLTHVSYVFTQYQQLPRYNRLLTGYLEITLCFSVLVTLLRDVFTFLNDGELGLRMEHQRSTRHPVKADWRLGPLHRNRSF